MKKCPMCGKPVEWKDNPARPFCSERCKLLDFGGWVNEQYAVPSDEAPLSGDSVQQTDDHPRRDDANSNTES